MNNGDIDFKLLDYFLGELTEEERREVEAWAVANEKNRRYFQRFQRIHFQTRWGNRAEFIQGNFKEIQKQIRRRLYIRRLFTVAAMFVLLFGVGIGYWLFVGTGDELKSDRQAVSIHPGETKALLYLVSGETIPLTKMTQELRKDGVVIQVDEQEGMSYDIVTGDTNKIIHRIKVPRGGEYKMTLSDGTKVWLNSDSEISYPVRFTDGERMVSLRGEAYFDVAKDEKCPFIVNVDRVAVKVYGTKFNVSNQKKDIVETVLEEGRVGVIVNGRETMLFPNQKIVYDEKQHSVTVEKVDDMASYVAWKDGNFVFNNESLENIMNKLALWYDVDVLYANDKVRKVRLSGDMVRYKDIQNLLYFFEQISDVKFEIKGKTIVVNYK
ncbi:FecR domain-containing protein [uncultured Sanguibacteroides sp.]|uniref:FecR domain-containing protein n=1 Tax=uncultured Sanguibacteroides sp. TaxID=1635151 RepID=UPI0025E765F7|nr:FecR domain-containing protein [uncultured Sanguibacteroides sp.]